MNRRERLDFCTWLDIRSGDLWRWLKPCPTCRRRPRRGYWTPRYDMDRTARMAGLPIAGHCRDCGKADR